MSSNLTAGIERVYLERSDFMVLALTGRTGSGCSTVAELLCRDFSSVPSYLDALEPIEKRKGGIAASFLSKAWLPFRRITISSIILSCLASCDDNAIDALLKASKVPAERALLFMSLLKELRGTDKFSEYISYIESRSDRASALVAWLFFTEIVNSFALRAKDALAASYAGVFQSAGDNLRLSGTAVSSAVDANKLFFLMEVVRRLCMGAVDSDRKYNIKSTRIVVDAVRNSLELVYLRDKFSACYAIAVTSPDKDRRDRLSNAGISLRDIDALDKREYLKKSLGAYSDFVSQNVQDCIQRSDLFLNNSGGVEAFESNIKILGNQIIKYVALMLRPGIITPTRDERCMQLAFVSRLNSGCISRQVGAAVADRAGSIKAVGWNDVPKGQVSCLLRDVSDLISKDEDTYSDYERKNAEFRRFIDKKYDRRHGIKDAQGLSCPYCFKDSYNELKGSSNQVHTRSLHAEENAFLQLAKTGNSGIEGGVLYTTASPCELCSKKAFQLGMTEVVYVDPYPGISSDHVLAYGKFRPKLRLFSGAVGHTYHKLYEAILPIKDELLARHNEDPQRKLGI
ncbi:MULTISPECIES: deoxycytidylate deaminase [Xanthomonas]|uniref:deoxycytidylate deaminase n=1 Tax=Xanthomonas TaxID=338 RepID=UPI000CEEE2D4|nr:deoxycytidylate deaminase [Xanthomonas arboricola]NIK52005.1 deoxycytidylate deaminase [Xanthomonas arboricola]PPT65567.1 hypothetical protein XarbCFBP8142_18555 [Xanthomonas arboricola]PPU17794.1 hypothetical protein XarbCFBP7610_18740 [Xanthomonas arboricola]